MTLSAVPGLQQTAMAMSEHAHKGWATEGPLANLPDIPGKFEKPVATVAQTPRAAAGTLLSAHDLYGTRVKIPYGGAPAG